MTTFAKLKLSEPLLKTLQNVNYKSPNPIQKQTIPPLLKKHNMINQTQTNTNKTTTFKLPLLKSINANNNKVQTLVLTPTRELCIQITQTLQTYNAHKKINPMAVFNSAPIRTQQTQLHQNKQIVVNTIKHMLDLISHHSLMLHAYHYIMLNKTNKMLDLNFLENVKKILSLTPNNRQTALFNTTIPTKIQQLTEHHLYDPTTIKIKTTTLTIDTIKQFYLNTKPQKKINTLIHMLKTERPKQTIVFTQTKVHYEQLFQTLHNKNMNVKALHNNMNQNTHNNMMINFKNSRTTILMATNVAAHSLNISTVTHIINFDVPTSPDVYVHHINHTNHIKHSNHTITFIEPHQKRKLKTIEHHASTRISPWAKNAHMAPTKTSKRPKHHHKPHNTTLTNNTNYTKLITNTKRHKNIETANLITTITTKKLNNKTMRNVHILERFALVEVPTKKASQIIKSVTKIHKQPIALKPIRA